MPSARASSSLIAFSRSTRTVVIQKNAAGCSAYEWKVSSTNDHLHNHHHPCEIAISCINGVTRVIAVAKRHFMNNRSRPVWRPWLDSTILIQFVADYSPRFTHPDAADGAERTMDCDISIFGNNSPLRGLLNHLPINSA